MTPLESQLAWEEKHRKQGQLKLQSQMDSAKESGRITDTPLGSVVLRRYLLWLSRKIAYDITVDLDKPGRGKAYAPLLHAFNPDVVALIAISELIGILANGEAQASTVGFAIGRSLYGELALSSFKDMNSNLYEVLVGDLQSKMSKDLRHRLTVFRMQAQQNGLTLPEWTQSQKLQVGMYILGLMSTPSEDGIKLCDMELQQVKKKTKYMVYLDYQVAGLMEGIEQAVIDRAGFAGPCLIPPQEWTGEEGVGGFHGALKIRAVRFFKGTSYQWQVMNDEGHDPTIKLRMLNKHQNVPWKVNHYILDVLTGMRERGLSIKKKVEFSSAHARLRPERPEYLDQMGEEGLPESLQGPFKEWKGAMRDWHTEARRIGRVELRLNLTLQAAREVAHLPEFYYVYQADYRGRMYPVSGALNPQGNDVSKALLHAARGEPVDSPEALWWFQLSIAAKYGIDKLSPDACVQWTKDNTHLIVQAASDPLSRDAFYWWSGADKPLQFLAACDEYRRYLEDPVGFQARIAVAMDGSCNGLQNYSAMGRDPVGGAATNLIQTADGVPNDIYGDVAKAAWRRLQKAAPCAIRGAWIQQGFDRSLTKQPVMTQVYGSTFGTCRKSIMSYCFDREIFKGAEYEHAEYAAKLVWEGIGDVVVWAKKAMDWLRESAGLILKEGADYITWRTQTGYRVVQVYDTHDTIQVYAHIGKRVRLKVPNSDRPIGPDKRRHRNAFPPNFIHSVDSSHMDLVTCDMEDRVPGCFLHFVHDDFGALPKHAAVLAKSIRNSFIKLHNGYSLDNIVSEYPFLNPPPPKGDLDINSVLSSINFFR